MKMRCVFVGIVIALNLLGVYGGLPKSYYKKTCPNLLYIVRSAVKDAIGSEQRMGASLLRLHFHDCFVQGCDASILLDDTATVVGEKTAPPNNNSVRGFEVVDKIKAEVEAACPGVVSCADILAIAARDSVHILGGPYWEVELGRRDSLSPGGQSALTDLPPARFNLSQLISSFSKKKLGKRFLVALSGGHTIGQARCVNVRPHIYNDTNIDAGFASLRKQNCPANGADNNLAPADLTPKKFDNQYFKDLLSFKGLLHSDQELFGDVATDKWVRKYAQSEEAFYKDFVRGMLKMARLDVLTKNAGEVRKNCRKVN